jgi:Fic family protein
LSRVLTTLLLLQAGYAYVPYSSLESIIENSKEDYYLSLRQTQATIQTDKPNWQPWLMFFIKSLQQQKRHLEVKVEIEQRMFTDLPELALIIIDYAKSHGRVTNRDIVRETGASSNTLKNIFSSLVKKGFLIKQGVVRSTWYSRS